MVKRRENIRYKLLNKSKLVTYIMSGKFVEIYLCFYLYEGNCWLYYLFVNVKMKWAENLTVEQADFKFYKRLHCADITSICPDNGFAHHALTI